MSNDDHQRRGQDKEVRDLRFLTQILIGVCITVLGAAVIGGWMFFRKVDAGIDKIDRVASEVELKANTRYVDARLDEYKRWISSNDGEIQRLRGRIDNIFGPRYQRDNAQTPLRRGYRFASTGNYVERVLVRVEPVYL